MLVTAIPTLLTYQASLVWCPLSHVAGLPVINSCYLMNTLLLMLTGLLVNGPYALITTAVSAELGTHKSLAGSSKALATVTAIIDGTGSVGAAVGPLLAGWLAGGGNWQQVFGMLVASDLLALVLLGRLMKREDVKRLLRWTLSFGCFYSTVASTVFFSSNLPSGKSNVSRMTEQKRMGRWYFGGLASAGAACCTHPLDLIKVQLQTKKDGNIGAVAQAKIIIRSEGFLALYNGLSASLVRQLTYSTTRFAIYEVAKQSVSPNGEPIPFTRSDI